MFWEDDMEKKPLGDVPADLKENPRAQFEYGRRSEKKLERTARDSKRLEIGNPNIGEVDLGNIEANEPSQPDDNDHWD